MAGAGYKLFNTGDVLTAQQVNEYLMQQTTMVFADAAARTSALSGVLAEGMVSYLQDTNTLEVYDGSAWVGATGDITGLTAGTGISISSATGPVPTITNSVATTFDALGDLVVGTGADTFAKLSVGESGSTIVADSSATTGLRWQADWNTGKNKIINGDFGIWQRGTSLSGAGYLADRFQGVVTTTTITQSQQSFTAGTAPVAGYEGTFFYRAVTTSGGTAGSRALVQQPIEDVRTFAGQTVTVSFWAKAGSGTPKIGVELAQAFGSGGSSAVTAIGATAVTISTSWARYTVTASVPSISGKTIGTGSSLNLVLWIDAGSDFATRASSIGNQSGTFDIWGVQVEAGSVATPFTTATGTLAGELQLARRYLPAITSGSNISTFNGMTSSTTSGYFWIPFDVPARVQPTGITIPALSNFTIFNGSVASGTPTAVAFDSASQYGCLIATAHTAGSPTTAAGNTALFRVTNTGSILFTGCEL